MHIGFANLIHTGKYMVLSQVNVIYFLYFNFFPNLFLSIVAIFLGVEKIFQKYITRNF